MLYQTLSGNGDIDEFCTWPDIFSSPSRKIIQREQGEKKLEIERKIQREQGEKKLEIARTGGKVTRNRENRGKSN